MRLGLATIGPGLLVYHGDGIVLGSGVKAGSNLTLEHQVTIGNRIGAEGERSMQFPELGDNVFVGCGAKILGPIRIGNNVRIGANAVVLDDVPDNATVVGIPARIARFRDMGTEEISIRKEDIVP